MKAMSSLEVTKIATTVSKEAFFLRNSHVRIGRYYSKEDIGDDGTTTNTTTSSTTVQISYSPTPITTLKSFWPPDNQFSTPIPQQRKRTLFWQYQRSVASHDYVLSIGKGCSGIVQGRL